MTINKKDIKIDRRRKGFRSTLEDETYWVLGFRYWDAKGKSEYRSDLFQDNGNVREAITNALPGFIEGIELLVEEKVILQ